jgi:hypothetical protein
MADKVMNSKVVHNIFVIMVVSCTICFLIGVPILIFGYTPRVLTDNQYQSVKAIVVGYGEESLTCYNFCNCRSECPGNRPNCYSWQKHTICDSCAYPCMNAWVVFSVIPPGPSFTFNAFNLLGPTGWPLAYLQRTYQLNSTIGGYYSSSSHSVVYGDTLNTSINCFIAGFVFTGLGFLILLCILIFCIINFIVAKRAQK